MARQIRYHSPSRIVVRRGSINGQYLSGNRKKANNAKHIRHRHSGAWKFRAPKKNRLQLVNLKRVKVKTDHGVVTLRVAASVLKSPEFNAVVCGLKPIPKAWLEKHDYGI